MAAAMLADSGGGAEFDFSYHPSMQDRALSPRRSGAVSCLLVFEDPRNEIGASESHSVDLLVRLEIDLLFELLPLRAAWFLLAAFGLALGQHFVAPNNRWLSAGHSQSAPE